MKKAKVCVSSRSFGAIICCWSIFFLIVTSPAKKLIHQRTRASHNRRRRCMYVNSTGVVKWLLEQHRRTLSYLYQSCIVKRRLKVSKIQWNEGRWAEINQNKIKLIKLKIHLLTATHTFTKNAQSDHQQIFRELSTQFFLWFNVLVGLMVELE